VSDAIERDIPIIFWPFVIVWRLLTWVLKLTGRIISAVVGLGLMAAGVAVSLTVVGAPIGVPVAAFGFLLLIRALF